MDLQRSKARHVPAQQRTGCILMSSLKLQKKWVVMIGVALILVFIGLAWLQVRQFVQLSSSFSGRNVQAMRRASTMLSEFERFERALERDSYQRTAESRAHLQLRYDLFVNQVQVFANAIHRPYTSRDMLYRAVHEAVTHFVEEADHYLGESPDREYSPAVALVLLGKTQLELREPIFDYMLHVYSVTSEAVDGQRAAVSRHLVVTLALAVVQTLLTGVFALGVVQLMRQRELSKTAQDRAEAELVAHLRHQEWRLEQLVAERTAELEAANARLLALSATDGLTGIANRRHFDDMLTQEWNRQARQGRPLALAMIDVDWFKFYNDFYGHQAGDDCLRIVAAAVASHVRRAGDMAARYGGEEFVFVAPGLDASEMQHLAETIRAVVEHKRMPHGKSPLGSVTLSIGVAVMVPTAGGSPEMLIGQADSALYKAKQRGRNQVVLGGALEVLI